MKSSGTTLNLNFSLCFSIETALNRWNYFFSWIILRFKISTLAIKLVFNVWPIFYDIFIKLRVYSAAIGIKSVQIQMILIENVASEHIMAYMRGITAINIFQNKRGCILHALFGVG